MHSQVSGEWPATPTFPLWCLGKTIMNVYINGKAILYYFVVVDAFFVSSIGSIATHQLVAMVGNDIMHLLI